MIDYETRHQLDFDGIDLTGRTDYGGIRFYALSESATLGNPVPVDRKVMSALLDGSVTVTDRHDNRRPRFQVLVDAFDSALLAKGEAMLFGSCSRRVLLGYVAADGRSPRTVFKAFTSHIELAFDDLDELRVQRIYALELDCSPFGYSDEEVVVTATAPAPVTPSTVVMDDGTSAVGWSSPASALTQPASSGGVIEVCPREERTTGAGWVSEATKTFTATDFSATPYISVDIKPRDLMVFEALEENQNYVSTPFYSTTQGGFTNTWNGPEPLASVSAYVDGVKLPLKNFTVLADGRTRRYTFQSVDTSGTSLRLLVGTKVSRWDHNPTGADAGVTLDNISRSNVAPGQSSSGRMTSLSFGVQGSARTTASIQIAGDPAAGLGDTLLFTSNAMGVGGYEPQCRQFLNTAGAGVVTVVDAAMLSGSRSKNTGGNTLEWNIPTTVLPASSYLVVARSRLSGGPAGGGADWTVTTTVATKVGSTFYNEATLPIVQTVVAGTPPSTVTDWDFISLGVVALPQQNTPAGSTAGVITIKMTPGGPTGGMHIEVDDLLLFHMGDGSDLTRVACGTGTPSSGTVHNHLFMDQPSPTVPRYQLYVGTSDDRADAFDPGYPTVKARGSHPITPGANRVWVATTGTTYPTLSYRYTPAWFTHAGVIEDEA